MSEMDQLDCALDLMRRMPPSQIEDNLANLIDLVPDLTENLLSAVDQPLKIATDQTAKRDYLLCDYNRDGDSYRSPWTNRYDPPLDDGALPSKPLRDLEVQANEVFDIYRDLYYEGGVSSVYCWDLDAGAFAAVVLIKKTQDSTKKGQVGLPACCYLCLPLCAWRMRGVCVCVCVWVCVCVCVCVFG
jgi:F-actin-capping protein subunit beta